MSKDLNVIISELREEHKDFFFSDNCISTDLNIEILCLKHDLNFKLKLSTYLDSKQNKCGRTGCRLCTKERRNSGRAFTKDQFVAQARSIHGGRFDYSHVDYYNSATKVDVICKKHGLFSVLPSDHLRKSRNGCKKCANDIRGSLRTLEAAKEFSEKASKLHDNKYLYDRVAYVKSSIKVEVVCKDHGEFWMTPNNHLGGQRCPACSGSRGFNTNKNGTFYVLSSGEFTKVGITNRDVAIRISDINRSSNLGFSPVYLYSSTGIEIYRLESTILDILRNHFRNPDFSFDGCTETFIGVDTSSLLQIISENIELNKEKYLWQ